MNSFDEDIDKEISIVKKTVIEINGAIDAIMTLHYKKGGDSAIESATIIIMKAIDNAPNVNFIYNFNDSFEAKMIKIVQKM